MAASSALAASSPITTHVLDQQRGIPAAGMRISLQQKAGDLFHEVAERITNSDGRVTDFMPNEILASGVYRLVFHVDQYYRGLGQATYFYPVVQVEFLVDGTRGHYHVPLLLSPYGYSTYRGS